MENGWLPVARGKPVNGVFVPINTKFSSITGILDYANSAYKLEPRTNDDIVFAPLSVEQVSNMPHEYSLRQNYPTPFNPSTIIDYSIPSSQRVTLKLYNLLGQEVMTLVDQTQNSGSYKVDVNASRLSTGIYFYQLRQGNNTETKKLMLVK